jgi:DNA mismatch endonuclease Vsr
MTRNNAPEAGARKARRGPSTYAPWPDVPETRRRTMASIRSRDTQPELSVRRMLHEKGYRFVVCRRVAGCRPDVLFTKRRKAIFVHGCFWHGHPPCMRGKVPKTRSDYWRGKIEANRARDVRALAALGAAGWEVLTLWECEVRRAEDLGSRLTGFLGPRQWPRREAASFSHAAE